MTLISALLPLWLFYTKAYFDLQRQPRGAKCGGERFESGETLYVSREETTGSLSCMFPLCGRLENSQIISQMYTDSISSIFVK